MQKFVDDYIPVELELVDENGMVSRLKSQKITIGKLRRLRAIDKMIKDKSSVTDNLELIFEQIIMFFGGKIEDYDSFTVKQITDAITYIGNYVKNPQSLQEQQSTK